MRAVEPCCPTSYTCNVNHIGIDIGGTQIKGLRLRGSTVEHAVSTPTPADDPEALVDAVVDQIVELRHSPNDSVGVAVAAFLDPTRRIVTFSPNIAWSTVPLAEILASRVGGPVVLENDANAACYAEFAMGSGQGSSSLAMLTLGTGVGGAVMVDGQLVTGASGVAGELGHLPLGPGSRPCGCGGVGCVETVASGTAIVSRVREYLGKPDATADDVASALDSDSSLRDVVLRDVGEALARSILTLHRVTNPQRVIIGGGVMERSGEAILAAIAQASKALTVGSHGDTWPEVVPAALGNRAGGIGAALLARHQATATG